MTLLSPHRIVLLGAAAVIGLALAAGPSFAAMEKDPPPPPPPPAAKKATDKKKAPATTGTEKKEKKSGQEFRDGYKVAYDLIHSGKYQAGIEAMHALRQDQHPDVATGIGFSSRKLGDYDKAKFWYDKALAADAKHVVTLSYYGMWHAEQGNVLKAEDFLKKIQVACGGTECEPYKNLKGVIDGKFTY
jgi:tetratricopeptide (TPR) repeat protein